MKTENNITDVDIKLYYLLHETVVLSSETLKNVPTFIIDETIQFFELREEYEKCDDVKTFFDENQHLVFRCTRKSYLNQSWNTQESNEYDNWFPYDPKI